MITGPEELWLKKRGIIIRADEMDLAVSGAVVFYEAAKRGVDRRGFFSVAISGGSTPRTMHRLFSREPYLSDIPWHRTHLFWVDERMVPVDHPRSNFGAAREDFLERVPIPSVQVHPIPVTEGPEKGAARYEEHLKAFFQPIKNDFPEFDLIFLGVGKDGHTASLLPGQPCLEETRKWVVPVKADDPDMSRVTMTYPVLNRAKQIVFLISGKDKAPIVRALFQTGEEGLPARGIQPQNGELIWLLDREAAFQLVEESA